MIYKYCKKSITSEDKKTQKHKDGKKAMINEDNTD